MCRSWTGYCVGKIRVLIEEYLRRCIVNLRFQESGVAFEEVHKISQERGPCEHSRFKEAPQKVTMTTGYIIGSVAGSFVIAYLCDNLIADKKIFGGTTPHTVAEKEWWQATDKKFQAWPRTAGPPVVMNPISRQNFIVKSAE